MSWTFNGVPLKIDKFKVEGKDYVLLKVAAEMFYPLSNSGAFSKLLIKHDLPKATQVAMHKLSNCVDTTAYGEMHAAVAHLQRALEPTKPRIASRFSIVKLEAVEELCKVSKVHSLPLRIQVLESLGLAVPAVMAKEREHAEDERDGVVNLVLDDELSAIHAAEAATLQQELDEYEPYKPSDEDDAKLEAYKLNPVSRHLSGQLGSFKDFQTKILECRREGADVATATSTSDVSTFLRFAGWLKSMNHEPMQCLSMFLSVTADDAQDFTTFLTGTREVSYGTVANYLNSLLNMMSYVSANAQSLESIHHAPFDVANFDTLTKCTKNLRQQAESQAKRDKLYKHRKTDWISWSEAKDTRHAVMKKVAEMPKNISRTKKLTLLTDALVINLFTVMPPDRCSVIRLLSVMDTLKQEKDNDNYYIDLTRFKHKTAKFYGPSMTPISPLITPLLKRFLGETQSFEFTEYGGDEEHNRTHRRYLFAQQADATQPLSSGHWCTRVKAAFRRHHSGGKAPCPTLLRSSFITALRSSNAPLSTLQSAAIAQKHSMQMQSSDTYDLETHRRSTSKAMEWCHEFAGVLPGEDQLALPAAAAPEAQSGPSGGNKRGEKRTAPETWVTQTHKEFSY